MQELDMKKTKIKYKGKLKSYMQWPVVFLVIMAIIFACHLQSTSTRQSTGLFRGMVIGMMALVGVFQKSNFARRRAANLH